MEAKNRKYSIINSLLILGGAILRINPFLWNRSFWLDEAYVALGVSRQSLMDILQMKFFAKDLPLPPLGFVFFEKIFIILLGNSELSLRIFPLICGIVSIFLFFVLIKKILKPQEATLALGLFIFSEQLIYYSSEAKQYSAEVMVALILMLLILRVERKEMNFFDSLLSGVGAGFVSLLSYISIFFMIPYFFLSIVPGIFFERKGYLKKRLIFFIPWSVGFIFQYLKALKPLASSLVFNEGAIDHFYFPTKVGINLPFFSWIAGAIRRLFDNPIGLIGPGIMFIFFVCGFYYLSQKNKKFSFLLGGSFGMIIVLAMLQKYPFGGRFLLFYLPFFYLLIVCGVAWVTSHFLPRFQKIFFMGIMAFLLVSSGAASVKSSFIPYDRQESRKVLTTFFAHYQKGEALYLNTSAKYALGYYHGLLSENTDPLLVGEIFYDKEKGAERVYYNHKYYMFNHEGFLTGSATEKSSRKLIKLYEKEATSQPRTWILLIHVNPQYLQAVKKSLSLHGCMINSWEGNDAYLFLYDMSQYK